MGDGIGGPVMGILTNNAFELLVSHTRKDNKEEYGKTEKIIIAKVDNPDEPQYAETTKVQLEQALKGKFVFDADGRNLGKISSVHRKANANNFYEISIKRKFYSKEQKIPRKEIAVMKKNVILNKSYD